MTDIEALITDMQAVKAAHPGLELQDILRMFNIKALQDLTMEIRKARTQ